MVGVSPVSEKRLALKTYNPNECRSIDGEAFSTLDNGDENHRYSRRIDGGYKRLNRKVDKLSLIHI